MESIFYILISRVFTLQLKMLFPSPPPPAANTQKRKLWCFRCHWLRAPSMWLTVAPVPQRGRIEAHKYI